MRNNIFDLISGRKIEIFKEYRRLYSLFEKTTLNCAGSFLCYVEKDFLNWKYRNRYLSAKEMMEDLQIDEKSMIKNMSSRSLLLYAEFIYNSLIFSTKFRKYSVYEQEIFMALMDNIISLLSDLNYEIRKIDKDKYIIIEKNEITSCVAEIKPDITNTIIEYRRFNLKGNISAKKEILQKLANKIEPLKKKFNGTNYNNIFDDTSALLNSLNIRHNNLEGSKKQEYVVNMTKEELEKWYDKTYDMILGIFILESYIDDKKELNELKSHLKKC